MASALYDVPEDAAHPGQPLLIPLGTRPDGEPVLVSATPPNLVVFDGSDHAVDLIADLTVRAVAARGLAHHRIWVADLAAAGTLPTSLGALARNTGVDPHVLVDRNELRAVIGMLRRTIAQRALLHTSSKRRSYLDAADPIGQASVLFVADMRYRHLSDKDLGALLDVLRFGPTYGVGALIAAAPDLLDKYRDFAALRNPAKRPVPHNDMSEGDAWVGDHVVADTDNIWQLLPHQVPFSAHSDPVERDRAVAAIAARDTKGGVGLEALLTAAAGTADPDDGITLRLGTGPGGLQTVTLNDSDPHMLCIGRSGSGKSTLIHQMVAGVVNDYSPEDMRLWVLDLKGGNEFADLAPALGGAAPAHLDRVVLDSEPELAQATLRAAVDELERRSNLFRSHRLRDLRTARAAGHRLPRMLIIVDEFQVLFAASENTAASALDVLARKGRSYGIHLLLTSQHLPTVHYGTRAAFAQATARIALGLPRHDRDGVLGARAVRTERPRHRPWVGGPPEGLENPDPRGTGWVATSTRTAAPFAFPAPDVELLASLRSHTAGDPLTVISGVYAPGLDRATPGCLDVGVDVMNMEPVQIPLDSTDTSHLFILGRDRTGVAAVIDAAYLTSEVREAALGPDSNIVDEIGAADADTIGFIHLDGAAPVGLRDDVAGALAAAARRNTHIVFVASSEAVTRRVLGIGWAKLARHTLALHASGYSSWPHHFKFRPESSRAALIDTAADHVATVVLREPTPSA